MLSRAAHAELLPLQPLCLLWGVLNAQKRVRDEYANDDANPAADGQRDGSRACAVAVRQRCDPCSTPFSVFIEESVVAVGGRDEMDAVDDAAADIHEGGSARRTGGSGADRGDKLFCCSACGYRCSAKWRLVVHERVHSGEKPYACLMCEYRCSRKSSLVVHERVHSGDKPYACSVCEYRCSRNTI